MFDLITLLVIVSKNVSWSSSSFTFNLMAIWYFNTKTDTRRLIKPKFLFFIFLLILNIVFYKINKETQFNYHQFLKYTIYNFKVFKIFKN